MKNSRIIIISFIIGFMGFTSCQKENLTDMIPNTPTVLSKELTKDTTRNHQVATVNNSETTTRIFPVEIEKVTYGLNGKIIGIFEKTEMKNWVEKTQYLKSPKRILKRIHMIAGIIHLADAHENMMIELDLLAKEVRFKDLQFDGQVSATYEIIGVFSQKVVKEDIPYIEGEKDTVMPQSNN